MKVLHAYLRLYLDCWSKTFKSLSKNAWTLLLPPALALVAVVLGQLLIGGMGRGGGFIWALLFDALLSCYLYFLSQVVAQSRTTLAELKTSVMAYFFPILTFLFILWLIELVKVALMRGSPAMGPLELVYILLVAILLNPVPEVIYQNNPGGYLGPFQKSFQFLQANWIEWFVFLPNLLIGGLFALGRGAIFYLTGFNLAFVALGGILLHVLMVYRGHLYEALDGTTHRQRMFKYRNEL